MHMYLQILRLFAKWVHLCIMEEREESCGELRAMHMRMLGKCSTTEIHAILLDTDFLYNLSINVSFKYRYCCSLSQFLFV